ncbi:YceI family protein [Candidatus Uhrbacteria bacterium]|nr:YceI family protein [Candidatus Uhrbacteria bacterium]
MSKKITVAIVAAFVLIGGGVGIFLYATRPLDTSKVLETDLSVQNPSEISNENVEESNTVPDTQEQNAEKQKADEQSTEKQKAVGQTTQTNKETNAKKETPPAPKADLVQYAFTQNTAVSFTIDEVLRGSPFTVVGATQDVSGSIFLNVADLTASTIGPILVDARTFHTDSPQRDGAIGRFILKAEQSGNEQIRFKPTSIKGMPKTIPPGSASLDLTISGDLTMSGVTKPATFKATNVNVTSDRISGTAQATVKRSDFDLQIPNIPFVANVSDEFLLKINLEAESIVQ